MIVKTDWSFAALISTDCQVEDFWALYNHIELASRLAAGCDYSLFKEGVKPMWEDERWMKFNDVSVLLLQTLVITGDPQKGPGGALAPLAFENMQIYLKIGKGSVIAGPPKVRPGSPMFVTLHSHSHLPPIFCHLKVSHAPLQQASDGTASLDAS